MNHTEEIKLVHKAITGELNPDEQLQYNDWRDNDPKNKVLSQQIEQIWEASAVTSEVTFDADKAYKKHLAKLNSEQNIKNLQEERQEEIIIRPLETSKKFSLNHTWLRSLAAIFVLGIAAIYFFRSNETVTTAEKDTAMTLNDGSKVWLSAGSEIKLNSFTPSNRNIKLKGRAYFDIAPNAEAPFKITTETFDIQVLGTEFLVNENEKEVFVKEGKVKVSNDVEIAILVANQKAVINENEAVIVANQTFDSSELWFNEDLIFNNTPFDEVIKQLSVAYNVKFTLPEKSDWSKCTLTSGSLRGNTLDQVLVILKLSYDLEYTRMKDNGIRFSKVKCK